MRMFRSLYPLRLILGFLTAMFLLAWSQPEQGLAALTLDLDNLEGEWLFRTDPQQVGEEEGWQRPEFPEKGWLRLKVPAIWEEQGITETYPNMPSPQLPPNLNVPNAYNGAAWYRKWVVVPKGWQGEELELFIGAVDDLDWTYFNGTLVGKTGEGLEHPSTVTRRYTIAANLVRFGEKNLLAIRVWDYGGPGGIHLGPVYLLPKSYLAKLREGWRKEIQKKMTLHQQFQSPPNHRRILQIIHNFPDAAHLERFLMNWKARGFGGIVCNVHFNDYLRSEEKWKTFGQGVQAALELGMTVWLYDEQGYPSGAAGGLTLEGHPEWEAQGLACLTAETEGEPVELNLPSGTLVAARAYRVRNGKVNLKEGIELANCVSDTGLLTWSPPAGRWRIFAFVAHRLFEGTHAEGNLFAKRPYPNLLMKEPTARFIQLTHQQYADRFPKLMPSIEAIFTDEPSLMSVFLKPQPHPVIPWSPMLAKQFEKENGYNLLPKLPALFADCGAETGKVRCDFWRLIGKLVSEGYFKQIQDWCHKHGIASTGHLLAEESIRDHVGFYGNFYACVRHLDYPGIDCLTSKPARVPWHIAKLIGSIAHLHGCEKTMSETSDFAERYRPAGDKRPVEQVGEDEIRGTLNRLYLCGINTITSYYTWHGLSTEQQRHINDYAGRLGVMLTGGQHVCDIAVFYPVESVWAHFVPATHGSTKSPEAAEIERIYREVSRFLFENRRDFDYVDSEVLRQAKVLDGRLRAGAETYRVLILPNTDTIPLDVWRKVASFWRNGGVVIAVGTLPCNSPQNFPDAKVKSISREIFGEDIVGGQTIRWHERGGRGSDKSPRHKRGLGIYIPAGSEPLLPKVIDAVLSPDFKTASATSPLRYAHYRKEGKEIYFVINDSPEDVDEVAFFQADGAAEIWDAENGMVSEVASSVNDTETGMTKLALRLKGYGSAFFVFPRSKEPKRLAPTKEAFLSVQLVSIEQATGMPFVLRPLAPAHVQVQVSPDESLGQGGRAPMKVEAVITIGNVDSWCFPELWFEKPIDLSAFAGLKIWTFVPEGQEGCGAGLLVILHEESGADYIADAHRPLSVGGWKASTLWFDSFQLAGWTKDTNNRLDLDTIRSIRIGWGGYYGRKDERVTFAIKGLELMRFVSK